MWLDKIKNRIKEFISDILDEVCDFFAFADIDDYFMLVLIIVFIVVVVCFFISILTGII